MSLSKILCLKHESAFSFLRNAETELKIPCPVSQCLISHSVNATRETEKYCTIIQFEFLAARWKKGNCYCFYDSNFCSCEIV